MTGASIPLSLLAFASLVNSHWLLSFPGQAATLKAGQVFSTFNSGEICQPQHFKHFFSLAAAMFEQQEAPWAQEAPGLADDGPKVGKAVVFRKQGAGRLILAHAVHDFIILADIGRIGNDKVKALRGQRKREHIAGYQLNPCSIKLAIGLCHCKRGQAFIEQQPAPLRPFQGQRNADAARAAAKIGKSKFLARQKLQSQINQQFCFGARNENIFVHHKIASVKFTPAENMGQGFSANEPAGQKIKPGSGSRIQAIILAQQIGDFIQAGNMSGKHTRAKAGTFDPGPCKKLCYFAGMFPDCRRHIFAVSIGL